MNCERSTSSMEFMLPTTSVFSNVSSNACVAPRMTCSWLRGSGSAPDRVSASSRSNAAASDAACSLAHSVVMVVEDQRNVHGNDGVMMVDRSAARAPANCLVRQCCSRPTLASTWTPHAPPTTMTSRRQRRWATRRARLHILHTLRRAPPRGRRILQHQGRAC